MADYTPPPPRPWSVVAAALRTRPRPRSRLRPILQGRVFVFTPRGGWPLPHWFVDGWNRVACRLWGHEDAMWHDAAQRGAAGEACVNCGTWLTHCTGTGIAHGRTW